MYPFRIGITGGIGAGKTTACKIIETMGYPVFYADKVAKSLQTNDTDTIKETIALLGQNAYQNDNLNRSFLAQQLFSNPKLLQQYNDIIHPKVRSKFELFVKENQQSKFVFNEAAILFETGSYKNFDATILVIADETTRIQRIVKRDQLEVEAIKKRMKNQWHQDKLKKMANYIISNNENEMLLPQINTIMEKLNNQFISS